MNRQRRYRILKANGGAEAFSRNKLFRSLRRSGLSPKKCRLITDKVSAEIYEGASTRDIYRRAFQLVKQSSPVAAAHYSLKKALFELGPTGHHFETFVARYFEARGFQTVTCRTIQGKFVTHEVDVVATKGAEKYFVECKFHNRQGIKNDIKIALYVKARWDDLREGPEGKDLTGFCLATNTAFTGDAIRYAKGTKLQLLGVNAPEEKSFFDDIRNLKLYPVTSLRRISKMVRNELIAQNILLAAELLTEKKLLMRLGMTEMEFGTLSEEIHLLQRNGT